MPLTAQQHQGLHGEGFVFALASSAGLLASRPILDVDGVDWLIAHPGPRGTKRSPKIEVQVKTWSAPTGDDESWQYRIRVDHFNALAGRDFDLRRYLVLVTVPVDPARFAVCADDCMKLGQAAYWLSLADQDPLPVEAGQARTVLVRVPRRNLLTPLSLVALVGADYLEAGA